MWRLFHNHATARVVVAAVDVESEAILVECNLSGSHSLAYDAPSLKPLWAHLPRPLGDARPFAFEFGPVCADAVCLPSPCVSPMFVYEYFLLEHATARVIPSFLVACVSQGDHAQRRDLRQSHHGIIMSIDPPGCVDIDDALSLKVLPNVR